MQSENANTAVKSVIIVGGGTAGWMSAIAMASVLPQEDLSITLIESSAIGIVGVGEATLPHIRYFNQKVGIDEAEMMRRTNATFKLGIEFKDWGAIGQSYIHPFGDYGFPINRVPFHHYISKSVIAGEHHDMDDYSLPVMAARGGKFQLPHSDPASVLSTFGYAFQFDAGLYGAFLRETCETRGVKRVEGKVVEVKKNGESGDIESVILEDGTVHSADFFIDCSGFRGLLIDKALEVQYQPWSQWLPCNRAVTAGCSGVGTLLPYTRATAKAAGWQWRIPLQNRVGNGYVYASDFIDDEAATDTLMTSLESAPTTDPRILRFTTGKREQGWKNNCVAIGLSGGFLEPLESTGIYLIQQAVTTFVELFPASKNSVHARAEYNRIIDSEFERVRDFLILHYKATRRDDSPFWNFCRTMDIPDSLQHKIDLFRSSGRVAQYDIGAFKTPSWLAVYYGQNIVPTGYDPMTDHMPDAMLTPQLLRAKKSIADGVASMSDHEAFIRKHNCAAPSFKESAS